MKKNLLFFTALLCAGNLFSKTLYLTPGIWSSDGAKYSVYDITNASFADFMTPVSGEPNMYEATVPESCAKVIFVRHSATATTLTWESKWNQTADLDLLENDNHYTISGWGSHDGSWSTYTVPSPSISFQPQKHAFIDETIALLATSDKITDPVYTFEVKTPGASDFVAALSPYQPTEVGSYTFKAHVAERTDSGTVVASSEEMSVTVELVPDPITIKLKIPIDWGTTISIWNWNEYTDGNFVSATPEGDFFTYTFTRISPLHFVAVNGSGWDGDSNQTVEVENVVASTCYRIDEGVSKRTLSVTSCASGSTALGSEKHLTQIRVHDAVLSILFEGTQQIEIYNVSGQQIEQTVSTNEFTKTLNSGLYFLRIGNSTHKILVR